MLAFIRKPGESFRVGDHIRVPLLRVQGGEACLGVEAPQSVRVLRKELVRRPPEYNLRGPGGGRHFADLQDLLQAVKREALRAGDGDEEVVRLEVEIHVEPK